MFETFSLALNGQQFHGSNANFHFYPDPEFISVAPPLGPVLGGTVIEVSGFGFLDLPGLQCSYNGGLMGDGTLMATFIDTTLIRCSTQTQKAQQTFVGISYNGQQAHDLGDHSFTFFEEPVLSEVVPASGTTVGGLQVMLFGQYLMGGFQPTCSFNIEFANAVVVPAQQDDSTGTLMCTTPPGDVGTVFVQVALNGIQYSYSSMQFSYFKPPSIGSNSPTSGHVDGGNRVSVTGIDLVGGTNYKCRFASFSSMQVVDATFVAATIQYNV
jgi:hypothetical protein